jgi:hypothetical protein
MSETAANSQEATMTGSGANFVVVQSIFGSGYVPEQHDQPQRIYLPIKSDREAFFAELLQALRKRLSLRQS